MGWCSGTELFDSVCAELFSEAPLHTKLVNIIEAFEDMDWDCQDDSDYRDHPAVVLAMAELHPDWFED